MGDELPGTPGGAPVATPASSPGVASAPVNGGSLPSVAELLDRRARGEKLSFRENGRIGAAMARSGRPLAGGMAAGDLSASPTSQNAAGASLDGLPDSMPDPGLITDTTRALVEAADATTVEWIRSLAAEAGADDKTAAKWAGAVKWKEGNKRVVVNTSPQVVPQLLAWFGIRADNYAATAFFGAITAQTLSTLMVAKEIKKLAASRPGASWPAGASPGPSQNLADRMLPDPALPAGAPKPIMGAK